LTNVFSTIRSTQIFLLCHRQNYDRACAVLGAGRGARYLASELKHSAGVAVLHELTHNMQTAKALGLAVSPSLLVRADQVVE
jgi:hypothetical protein